MEKQVIIALGREFGSGGHYVAQKIAQDLSLKYYDRKILEDIAEEKNIRIEYLEKYDEKKGKVILFRNVRGYTNSLEEIVAEIQFEYLRKKAADGESLVIVGRCADEIFRGDKRLISIFVLGDWEDKIRRVMERHQITRDEAVTKMKRNDRERKRYHNRHSEIKWGDSRGYDICINSSKLGINKTADILELYIKECIGLNFTE
ncbi:MAG: AAA family ATPase [Blautia sp.]